MKIARSILDFYINSSIHVALAAVSLSMVTILQFHLLWDPWLLAFIFFGTITGYNFVKYAGIAKLHHRSLARNLRLIQMFSLVCFLALIGTLFHLETAVLLWAIALGFFTLMYALPMYRGKRNLRSIPGMKVFVIAAVWAGVSVVLPLVGSGEGSTVNTLVEIFQRFLFVLVLMFPFEIRDTAFDPEELGTIPQRFGQSGTKFLGTGLLGLVCLMELFQSSRVSFRLSLFFSTGLLILLLWKSRKGQSVYYTSFMVEGIPILWAFLLWVFQG